MQTQEVFISLSEPVDYDITDKDTGRQNKGISYKVGLWSGEENEMPLSDRLKDDKVYHATLRQGLKFGDRVTVTRELTQTSKGLRVGKILAIDKIQVTK